MRICTWNIHAWGDAAGRSRVDDVIAVLAGLQADVVVLNEVVSPGGPLIRLSQALDRAVFFGAAAFGGNAVLAKAGSSARAITLSVRGGEARNALVVDVGGVVVVGVHLDHRHEDVRCEQLRVLIGGLSGVGPHAIVGDLNAIDPADYPPSRLAEVAAMRARHRHEAPRADVVTLLREAGYVDSARVVAPAGPLPERLGRTCWAGTRIDHVWLDAGLAAAATVKDIRVIDSDASDHAPVVVELGGVAA
jgi:endonuclease/exonuclease/phosphatase family metal-dependent hydrolase